MQQFNVIDQGPPPSVLGTIAEMLGQFGPPINQRPADSDRSENLEAALAILLELSENGEASPDVRFLLSLCYRDSIGKNGETQRKEAIETLRSLTNDFPNNVDYLFALAEILSEPGRRRFVTSKSNDANLEECIAILEKLAAQHPNIPRYRRLLSLAVNRLGMEQLHRIGNRDARELSQIIELFERSRDIQSQLVLEFPKSSELKYWLAKMIRSYGESMTIAERYDDAYQSFAEAKDIAEELSEDESTGVPALHLLIQLQREIERVHRKQGEASQAKAARLRAEEYRKKLPPPPKFLENLGR